MMNQANATAKPAPVDVLRAALPALGYTLSTDCDTIWNSFYDRNARKFKRAPTRGEMRATVEAWIIVAAARMAAATAEMENTRRG